MKRATYLVSICLSLVMASALISEIWAASSRNSGGERNQGNSGVQNQTYDQRTGNNQQGRNVRRGGVRR